MGALNWVSVPTQPIEILIAFSILISAAHAIKPIFAGKELYIAGGFVLIHGLAFASTLSKLNLDSEPMAMSIFGFNIGIELMQLFIISLIIPWFIILSRNNAYSGVRIGGAIIAAVASIAWIIERITLHANIVSSLILIVSGYAKWIILILALSAFASYFIKNISTKKN